MKNGTGENKRLKRGSEEARKRRKNGKRKHSLDLSHVYDIERRIQLTSFSALPLFYLFGKGYLIVKFCHFLAKYFLVGL